MFTTIKPSFSQQLHLALCKAFTGICALFSYMMGENMHTPPSIDPKSAIPAQPDTYGLWTDWMGEWEAPDTTNPWPNWMPSDTDTDPLFSPTK